MADSYLELNWSRFKEGDKEAFAVIYNHHVDALYRYATKICTDEYLVKDAIQEIFLDLYLKREKNRTKPEFLTFYLALALNIIELNGLARPLMRNNESRKLAKIENNHFVNVADTLQYENRRTKVKAGLAETLNFECGYKNEYRVNGWNTVFTPVKN